MRGLVLGLGVGCGCLALACAAVAEDKSHGPLDALIATHAKSNGVPESLVHRVIKRESRYNPAAVGSHGAMGLMQIKVGTARALGYTGPPEGLLDPATNLTYAVRYLAGAFRAADGNVDRADAYYRSGYYRKRKSVTASVIPRLPFLTPMPPERPIAASVARRPAPVAIRPSLNP
jgi:soluble lytic murein transglycosylase-like protein